eukprot:Tamp_27556.p1 GENE.Tamp_27556~~Tamp_27556.p1  ORF type:complete len:176 (-),score=23.14 Tamp_27556:169-696(-)
MKSAAAMLRGTMVVVLAAACLCTTGCAASSSAARTAALARVNPARCDRLAGCALLRLRGGSAAPPLVSNFEEVGTAFVQHYYQIFDSNRGGLQGLYQDTSMLTFEGEKIMGAAAIAQKLVGLPFQTVKHEVVTVDSQPTAGGGVLVSACGNLKVDSSEHAMKFSQVFVLMPQVTN